MLKNLKSLLVVALLCVCVGANAQLKYTSEGKITLGDTSPHEFYTMTMNATGAIEKTSQKIGSYSYSKTSGRTNGTWNLEMGYGLCNAFAAVSAANNITTFNNQSVTSNTVVSGWFIQSKNVNVSNKAKLNFNIGEALTIDVPFTVAAGSQLEIAAN